MKLIAMLVLISMTAQAQRIYGCRWNCGGVPVNRSAIVWPRPHAHLYRAYPSPVYHSRGVSTGSAVASAIAVGAIAGVVGYQMGRNKQNTTSQPSNCKTVGIDNEQKLVCRDASGNWSVQ